MVGSGLSSVAPRETVTFDAAQWVHPSCCPAPVPDTRRVVLALDMGVGIGRVVVVGVAAGDSGRSGSGGTDTVRWMDHHTSSRAATA